MTKLDHIWKMQVSSRCKTIHTWWMIMHSCMTSHSCKSMTYDAWPLLVLVFFHFSNMRWITMHFWCTTVHDLYRVINEQGLSCTIDLFTLKGINEGKGQHLMNDHAWKITTIVHDSYEGINEQAISFIVDPCILFK